MTDIQKQLAEALERIEAFIKARSNRRGMDPEVIYTTNGADLLMSDLKALAAHRQQEAHKLPEDEYFLEQEIRDRARIFSKSNSYAIGGRWEESTFTPENIVALVQSFMDDAAHGIKGG